MKYIKEIKEIKNIEGEDIINLSEYLQEFFDKYHIKHKDNSNTTDLFWMVFKNLKVISIQNVMGGINHEDDFNIYSEIAKHLKEIQPKIEKRLGREIRFYFGKEIDIEII